jgi:hypothetical protein
MEAPVESSQVAFIRITRGPFGRPTDNLVYRLYAVELNIGVVWIADKAKGLGCPRPWSPNPPEKYLKYSTRIRYRQVKFEAAASPMWMPRLL